MTYDVSGIYLITNTRTGQNYVGQSINVYHRINEHKRGEGIDRQYIDRAIQLSPDDFEYIVLEETSLDKLSEREQYWADQYNVYYPNGYNLVQCGEGGHYPEALKKIISCYDLEGNKINTYESVKAAERAYPGICVGTLLNPDSGKKTRNNMYFAYGDADTINITKPKTGKNGGKTIYQYDKYTGNFIQEFYSLVQAEQSLNKPGGNKNISAAANGKIKSAYGFLWSYIKGENYNELSDSRETIF